MCSLIAAATVAGIGMQAYSTKKQIDAKNQSHEYNAMVAEQNQGMAQQEAQFARAKAADAIARGKEEHRQILRRGEVEKGAQRAGFAASGVSLGSGSVSDVLIQTESEIGYEAAVATTNASREAWYDRVQGVNADRRASNYGLAAQGERSQKSGWMLPVATSILGGATDAYEQGIWGSKVRT